MMLVFYFGISIFYLVILFYIGGYKKPINVINQTRKNIAFDVVLSIHEDRPELKAIIQLILDEKIPGFNKLILIEDGVSIESGFINSDLIEVVSLPENVGKVKAQRIGLNQSQTEWVLLLDADIYWDKGALMNALNCTDTSRKLWALPLWEKFHAHLKFLQFEECAIKSLTLKGWGEDKKTLFSSAALFVERNFALQSLKEFDDDYGWDMYLVKNYTPHLGLVFPTGNNTLLTDSKSNYLSYIKQRVRWINNGLKFNGWPLFSVGFIVFLSFVFDLVVIFSFNYNSQQIYFSLLSIWLIKTISTFLVARKTAKMYSYEPSFLPFFSGHLFYGLNIGIILIFLVLQRMKKFVTNGTI